MLTTATSDRNVNVNPDHSDHKAVFCISKNLSQTENIVSRLNAAGIPYSDISVLYPEAAGQGEIAHVKNTKAPEGTATGAASGGVIGGALGLLAGIGALAIPGVGPFIAAGPIMAALGGAAVGATTGGIIGGLIGLGIPEVEAKHYEQRLHSGGYFISVHARTDEVIDRTKAIFEEYNAESISSTTPKDAPKN